MDNAKFFINFPVVFGTIGAVFLILWIGAIFGFWRKWFWDSQTGIVYGYIGLAFALFVAAFQEPLILLFDQRKWMVDGLIILFLVIGVTLPLKPPNFLKPKWVQQIEREPKWVYKEMVAQIKNGYNWQAKLIDYDTLASWIKEIKQKHRKK